MLKYKDCSNYIAKTCLATVFFCQSRWRKIIIEINYFRMFLILRNRRENYMQIIE